MRTSLRLIGFAGLALGWCSVAGAGNVNAVNTNITPKDAADTTILTELGAASPNNFALLSLGSSSPNTLLASMNLATVDGAVEIANSELFQESAPSVINEQITGSVTITGTPGRSTFAGEIIGETGNTITLISGTHLIHPGPTTETPEPAGITLSAAGLVGLLVLGGTRLRQQRGLV